MNIHLTGTFDELAKRFAQIGSFCLEAFCRAHSLFTPSKKGSPNLGNELSMAGKHFEEMGIRLAWLNAVTSNYLECKIKNEGVEDYIKTMTAKELEHGPSAEAFSQLITAEKENVWKEQYHDIVPYTLLSISKDILQGEGAIQDAIIVDGFWHQVATRIDNKISQGVINVASNDKARKAWVFK